MTFQQRYKYNPNTDFLGKGGFARVYKAKDIMLDREVAIKIFNATDKGQYTVIEEIKKAIRLHHPNLLRYYDVAIVENTNALGETDTLQIGVMELANAGDLKQFVRRNPGSPMLFTFLQQVLSGLEYLHQKGIIHRDLKPQNILLVEEDGELTAKISDFGISKSIDSGTNSSSMAIGTIEYMAPEQFSPAKYGINGKIGTNVDLWSFGIMVHELLTNEPLFGQRNGNTTAEQIMNAILSQTLPPDIETLPEPYKKVVKKCLVTDARHRIQKANELISLLNESLEETPAATMPLSKSLFSNANRDVGGETMVLPKPTDTPKEDAKKTSKSQTKKRALPYIILIIIVLGASAAGVWWWINKSAQKQEIDSAYLTEMQGEYQRDEYQIALKNVFGSTEFISHMQNAASSGYDSAQLQLAYYYTQQKQYEDAWPYIEKLIIKTDGKVISEYQGVMAMYALFLLHTGEKDNALRILRSCAYDGDAYCAFELGMIYYEGKAVEKNNAYALERFQQSADKNNDKAQTMLGNMYIMGQGVPIDNNKAIKYYLEAVEKGNVVAMYAMGLAYTNGMGVEKDEAEATKMFKQVVEKGGNADVVKAAQKQLGEN